MNNSCQSLAANPCSMPSGCYSQCAPMCSPCAPSCNPCGGDTIRPVPYVVTNTVSNNVD